MLILERISKNDKNKNEQIGSNSLVGWELKEDGLQNRKGKFASHTILCVVNLLIMSGNPSTRKAKTENQFESEQRT